MNTPHCTAILAFALAPLTLNTALAQSVEKTLAGMATQVSKNLPMMVNAEVQATAVAASGNRIMYKYNVLKPASRINASQLKHEHYANSLNAMCSNPGIARLLKQGAVLMYQFYDNRNVFLFDITLTQNDCSTNRLEVK
jgi:hypothetical protein